MAKSNVSSLLTSVDDLFTTQAERDTASRETVVDIPLEEISDFPDHPFKVRMDEAMMEMADSIRRYGVLVPGMVRPKPEGGYEMVAGHRRKMGSTLAQKKTMPCLVRDLTDDEAIIIMVDSNLQRESLLPSEKAFAYKMKLEAMNRQGQRTDLDETLRPVGAKLRDARSDEQLANTAPDTLKAILSIGFIGSSSLSSPSKYRSIFEKIIPRLSIFSKSISRSCLFLRQNLNHSGRPSLFRAINIALLKVARCETVKQPLLRFERRGIICFGHIKAAEADLSCAVLDGRNIESGFFRPAHNCTSLIPRTVTGSATVP